MTDVGDDAGGDGPASGDDGPVALARTYYRALDEGDYDLLANVLAPGFVHERPDRILEGRDRFVRFMREERPQTDTSHPIDGAYVPADDCASVPTGDCASVPAGDCDEPAHGAGSTAETEVVVRGRLLAADGSEITAFADVFTVRDGRLAHLRTFTHPA